MSSWFAIHLRNGGSILVDGDVARDRAMARKVPAAVEWSVPVIHRCRACGRRGPWQTGPRGWCWVGAARNARRGGKVEKFCSHACRLTVYPAYPRDDKAVEREDRVTLQGWEPVPDSKRWNSWAVRREREQAFKAHRRFEMPVHPNTGGGWCRWCGDEILDRRGKNRGKRSKQRTWHHLHQGDHRDCYHEYLLHTDRVAQHWFLVGRDGPGCADCGKGDGRWVLSADYTTICYIRWSAKLEVDHETALWLIAYLPPDQPAWRRALFSPDNLKLRCPPCHQRKSAREAADRARRRG